MLIFQNITKDKYTNIYNILYMFIFTFSAATIKLEFVSMYVTQSWLRLFFLIQSVCYLIYECKDWSWMVDRGF